MLPIRDHNPSLKTPYVTYGLMLANIAVFLSYWLIMSDELAIGRFFYDWAMIPRRVTGGDQIYTMFTSIFLHGGILHLAGNMLFLWIFGDNLEEELGHIGYLAFYLAAGWAAGFAHLLSAPLSTSPVVGASGAIAGVMGGYLLLFPKARIDILLIFIVFYRIIAIPAWLMLGLWFGLQLFNGLASDSTGGGVAYWAHAGGFVVGLVFILPLWLRRGGMAYWSRTSGHPPHPEAKYRLTASHIPNIRRRK